MRAANTADRADFGRTRQGGATGGTSIMSANFSVTAHESADERRDPAFGRGQRRVSPAKNCDLQG